MKLVVDVSELTRLQRSIAALPGELRDKAIAAGLNRVAEKGRTETDRAIRDEYVISSERVRNSISLRRASAAGLRFEAVIDIFGSANRRGRSLNVIHFMERKVTFAQARRRAKNRELFVTGKGGRLLPILRFVFKKGSGGKRIEGAFIGNKGRTVFRRIGKPSARDPRREAIAPVQVIDVPAMFRSKKVRTRVLERINRDLPIELDRAAKAVLARIGR